MARKKSDRKVRTRGRKRERIQRDEGEGGGEKGRKRIGIEREEGEG